LQRQSVAVVASPSKLTQQSKAFRPLSSAHAVIFPAFRLSTYFDAHGGATAVVGILKVSLQALQALQAFL